jgi:glucose-fructose oxidoreductase
MAIPGSVLCRSSDRRVPEAKPSKHVNFRQSMKRRGFLKAAVPTLAGSALAHRVWSSNRVPQQKSRLGVALVGLGYYSTDLLAPALQLTKNCYLAGIVTGTPAKAERWMRDYKIPAANVYNYQSFDRLADNDEIDVVYVVLPPSMHAEYCIRAARAGKHIWCEKPMAVTAAECQSMIEACTSNKVKLSIGYRMQHEPNTQEIIRFRRESVYGKVQRVTAFAGYFDGRTNHWKQQKKMGGGSMYDMGVYPLNAARYAAGLEPVAVTATKSTTRPQVYHEVDETMHFRLEFPGGATAECESSFGKGMNDLRVECSKGWYSLSPFQAYGGIRGETSDGKKLTASIPNQQAKQMDDDALAILQNKEVSVPGEEGLKDIRVVEAIHRSADSGRRVEL